jgi:Flp pilus assembly pilin Flp
MANIVAISWILIHAADRRGSDKPAPVHDAQGLVEYSIIILLIALAVIVSTMALGSQLQSLYSRVAASLTP